MLNANPLIVGKDCTHGDPLDVWMVRLAEYLEMLAQVPKHKSL